MSVPNTHDGPTKIEVYMKSSGSVYFIGIGGVMMASLALLTARAGHHVSGSDRTPTATTAALEAAGITVFYRHAAENIPADCGLVVYTVAISNDNPEYMAAAARHIPCVSRADYLGWLMTAYRHRVGVAGMHGKSTCTSMCTQLFLSADANPTVLIGADYPPIGGAYRLGGSENFVFEACEYMDSFLDFRPTIAVLLNMEMEHVDYFKSLAQIRSSFAAFAGLTGPEGVTIANADDEGILGAAQDALAAGTTGRVLTFSTLQPSADFYAQDIREQNGCPSFTLMIGGEAVGRVALAVTGRHQVYNALAASAAAYVCGLSPEAILSGLAAFRGVSRRMDYRGEVNGAKVYDDYGHHPTEIRRTLEGAAALCGTHEDGTPGQLICFFQPHTYSRTAQLYMDFMTAFDAAARVFFVDIYAARETDTLGVSSAGLARDIALRPDGPAAGYCPTFAAAARTAAEIARPGDVMVIMGAGDIIKVSGMLCPARWGSIG